MIDQNENGGGSSSDASTSTDQNQGAQGTQEAQNTNPPANPAPGSVADLPANRPSTSGVRAPELTDVQGTTPQAIHDGRIATHEKAEAARAAGHGAEGPRFNVGATE